jgi:2-keto-3-deoxy-L-rhamnonate aldolase RhmA
MCPWPGLVEVIGQVGCFDYVEFAAEYAPYDLHDLDHLSRAAELADLDLMIKIDGYNREFVAQRAMAAGIQHLLFADVRTAADARAAVEAVRAEPRGANGIRKDRRTGYVGGYASPEGVVEFCEDAVVALMIEKQETVENLDDILSVETVDMVQFGPADYALSLGDPGGRHREAVRETERSVIQTAHEYGVEARAEIKSPSDAAWYREQGIEHFSLNTDVNIIHQWLREEGTELEANVRG